MQETQVRSLAWEDPLEKETAAHSSILTWRILQREEPGGLQSMGLQRVRHDLVTKTQRNVMQSNAVIVLLNAEAIQLFCKLIF